MKIALLEKIKENEDSDKNDCKYLPSKPRECSEYFIQYVC